jgi:hypothetical protein
MKKTNSNYLKLLNIYGKNDSNQILIFFKKRCSISVCSKIKILIFYHIKILLNLMTNI